MSRRFRMMRKKRNQKKNNQASGQKQYISDNHIGDMTPEERALIRALPNRLLGIIFGIVLVVNAEPVGEAAPDGLGDIASTNMTLFGGVIIFLSFLRTLIDYWLKITYPEDKQNPPLPGDRE